MSTAVIFLATFEATEEMKRNTIRLLSLLSFLALAQSDQICNIDGTEVTIPDGYDCEGYVKQRAASFRFPTFPWIRFPPILTTLLPLWPRWPTTPAPDSDSDICPDDVIKAIKHPDDCGKYILCVFGTEVKRSCPGDLHFSRQLEKCVDPDEAECEDGERVWECPEEDDLENLVFLPNTEDCSKYYVCFGGKQIPLSCAEGFHWSIKKETCMDKEDANCKFEDDDDDIEECPETGVKLISHPNNCEKYIVCVEGTGIKRNCAPGFHFSREFRSCVDPEIAECEDDSTEQCPDTGVKSISHPDNCEKYVLCVNGNRIKRDCPPGLHFSRDLRVCTNPDEAECEDNDIEQCPDTGIKSISHPDNCEKFVFCVNGIRIKRDCPPGLHFSRDLRICTDPDKAECEDDDEHAEECPDTGVKSISHPDNCEKYVLCVNGNRIKRDCPAGLHFSRSLRVCTDPEEAECEENDIEQCPDTGIKSISHPDNCEKFVFCVNGIRIKRDCPPGLHFSRESRTCTTPEEAECEDSEIEQCPDSGILSISHPDNCEMFVFCVNGIRIKRDCPAGLHFSRESRTCTTPAEAQCEDQQLSCPKEDDLENLVFLPNKEDCGAFYVCFGGEPIPLTCGAGLHWSVNAQTCLPEALADCEFGSNFEECPDEGIKSISHPENCEKYILCIGGSRIKMDCAPGFHFSRDFGSCVQPDIANCE